MRTAIKAGWIVGYDNRGHNLIRNGVVVFEDNKIVSVGLRFDGSVTGRIAGWRTYSITSSGGRAASAALRGRGPWLS
jgi:hypothetical protein